MNRVLRAGAVGAALVLGILVGGAAGAALPTHVSSAQASASVQQVIQRANAEQVQAFATRDASLMADTSTVDHLRELSQINQNLASGGVTSIRLTDLAWGPVGVNGASASATTYETWSVQYRDGSTRTSRDTNVYTLVQDNGVWKIQANEHPESGAPLPVAPTVPNPAPPESVPTFPFPFITTPGQVPGAPQPAPGQVNPAPRPFVTPSQGTSHNWSGYSATNGKYTSVSATWTVPQVQSTGAPGVGATWVGIGGVTSRDLIQAGTQETDRGTGRVEYSAWIEMLPQASRPVPFAVHPGDSVSVSIAEQSASNWQISFKNNTTGQNYQTSVRYASSYSSAEWVVEAPSAGGDLLPLDSFGSVSFSGASATQNGQTVNLSRAQAEPITMLNARGQALALPSGIGGDGASFSVTRTDAPAAAVGSGRRSR